MLGSLDHAQQVAQIALWCNGNTSPFGGGILGSNPGRATNNGKSEPHWLRELLLKSGEHASAFRVRISNFPPSLINQKDIL